MDCVGEVLEAESMVGEPGNRQRPRDRAERDDQLAVRDGEQLVLRLDLYLSLLRGDAGRAAEDELGVRTHLPERDDDVSWLERAGRRLGQHRRVEHEVLRRDDRCASLLQEPRDVAAGKSAAENQRAAAGLDAATNRRKNVNAPALSSISFRLPHFWLCTQEGQPSLQGQPSSMRAVSPTQPSKAW